MRPLALLLSLAALLALACGEREERAEAPRARPGSEPRFATRRERRLEAKPEWLCAADLDGDGRVELAATTIAPGLLLVWRGTPQGLAREALRIEVGGHPLRPVALAARGEPARRPLAVASRASGRLLVLDVLGEHPERALLECALPATPRAIAAGRAAGRERVAIACDERKLALVDAGGALEVHELQGELPRCMLFAAGGEGLWIGYQDSLRLDFHSLEPSFAPEPSARVELGGIPRALLELDLDGDGALELAVAGGDRELWVFGLEGAGAARDFAAGRPRAPRRLETDAIPIDLEPRPSGAGATELVLLHAAGLNWSRWSGGGLGGPVALDSDYAGQTPLDAALADEDGDGLPELWIANRDSQCLSHVPASAAGFARVQRVPTGGFPTRLSSADLDGDGSVELLALGSRDDSLTLVAARASGLGREQLLALDAGPRALALGDLDGDGAPEVALLLAAPSGAKLRFYEMTSRGLQTRVSLPDLELGGQASEIAPLDLEGDGRVGFAVLDDEGERLLLVERAARDRGEIGFQAPRTHSLAPLPSTLAALELDGDAGQELAVGLRGASGAGTVLLLDFRGRAGERAPFELARLSFDGAPQHLLAADLDGDGRDDLALVGARGGAEQGFLRVWLRDPRSARLAFRALGESPAGGGPRRLAAADLDGDGLLELAAATQLAHAVELWRARAASGPGPRGPTELARLDGIGAGLGCFDLGFADLDRDGLLDLAVLNAHGDDLSAILQLPIRH